MSVALLTKCGTANQRLLSAAGQRRNFQNRQTPIELNCLDICMPHACVQLACIQLKPWSPGLFCRPADLTIRQKKKLSIFRVLELTGPVALHRKPRDGSAVHWLTAQRRWTHFRTVRINFRSNAFGGAAIVCKCAKCWSKR